MFYLPLLEPWKVAITEPDLETSRLRLSASLSTSSRPQYHAAPGPPGTSQGNKPLDAQQSKSTAPSTSSHYSVWMNSLLLQGSLPGFSVFPQAVDGTEIDSAGSPVRKGVNFLLWYVLPVWFWTSDAIPYSLQSISFTYLSSHLMGTKIWFGIPLKLLPIA